MAPTDFTCLPAEIRNEIYELALVDERWREPHYGSYRPLDEHRSPMFVHIFMRHRDCALLSVKSSTGQIAKEAFNIFFSKNKFIVKQNRLQDFLMGTYGLQDEDSYATFHITHLVERLMVVLDPISSNDADSVSEMMTLVQSCPRLKEIKFQQEHEHDNEVQHCQALGFLKHYQQAVMPISKTLGDRCETHMAIHPLKCTYDIDCYTYGPTEYLDGSMSKINPAIERLETGWFGSEECLNSEACGSYH